MNVKEKEILRKLFNIANNQQKVLKKLAQKVEERPEAMSPGSSNVSPFHHEIDKSDPNAAAYEHDPLYSPKEWEANYDSPKTNQLVQKYEDFKEKAPAPVVSNLPVGVKEMLDRGAPALKHNVMLHFSGQSVSVRYNKNALPYKPESIQKLLTNALPGYEVQMPIAETNNLNAVGDWFPNYN